MKVIIVGGVAGGASCAARLRRLDEKAEILMVERGPYVSYANCGLPYHEVVGRAYEQQSLMITTNLHFEQWTEVFGSERLTGALLDRLTHRCHIIEANGESYRLRQAKKRNRTSKTKQTIN